MKQISSGNKLKEIQTVIDDRKRAFGYEVKLLIEDPVSSEIVRDILNLRELPNSERSIEKILSFDNGLLDKYIDRMVNSTNVMTFSGRLKNTERVLIEKIDFFEDKKINILDIGVGGTHHKNVRAITSLELANTLTLKNVNCVLYGGDIRINQIEEINNKIILFPLDIFNPDEYVKKIYEKYNFQGFDIIRCSNLLGHFKNYKRQIIIENFMKLASDKALLIFNTRDENVYTLFIKNNENIETELIY